MRFAVLALAAGLAFAPVAQAQRAPETFAPLARQLLPAVVNISTTQAVQARRGRPDAPEVPQAPPGSPFEEFFRDFFNRNNGRAIYKPLTSACWISEQASHATFTSVLTEDLLRHDGSLANAPGIYQEFLPKAFELRVTVIGRSVFGLSVRHGMPR